MDRRDPYNQPMDQPRPNPHRGGRPQNPPAAGGLRQGNGPTTQERVNLNGDDIHVGRRQRRPTRLSQSESQGSGAEEEWAARALMEAGPYGQSPVLQGMQGDHVWYDRSAYEEAESTYRRRMAGGSLGNGNPSLSSSPRNNPPSRAPNTSRTLTFRAKRTNGQQQTHQDQEQTPSPGTPRRQPGRNRNRSSSEEANGGGRGRGGYRGGRRRGFSENEGRPRRDNIKMSGLECLAQENIWFEKSKYDEAETRFYEGANGPSHHQERETSAILQEIANARQNIQKSLDGVKTALQSGRGHSRPQKRQHRTSSSHAGGDQELVSRMKSLELENQSLQKVVEDLRAAMFKLESRVCLLEKSPSAVPFAKAVPVHQVKVVEQNGDDEDSDIDLFGSDEEEDEEAERLKEERVAAYAAKKSKKPTLIAKSSILLDVKPWDDETDMAKLEECVRTVQADGLLWGSSKLVPVGYGIKKLQIQCVVEDDKVGTDMLEEEITKFEDYVQSVDIAAFNKI